MKTLELSFNKRLLRCLYGRNKYVDVTTTVLNNIDKVITVNNILFKNDPCIGVHKELLLIFEDGTKESVDEFEKVYIKTKKIFV